MKDTLTESQRLMTSRKPTQALVKFQEKVDSDQSWSSFAACFCCTSSLLVDVLTFSTSDLRLQNLLKQRPLTEQHGAAQAQASSSSGLSAHQLAEDINAERCWKSVASRHRCAQLHMFPLTKLCLRYPEIRSKFPHPPLQELPVMKLKKHFRNSLHKLPSKKNFWRNIEHLHNVAGPFAFQINAVSQALQHFISLLHLKNTVTQRPGTLICGGVATQSWVDNHLQFSPISL